MSDLIRVQAVVLSAMPMGEYDKRLVLLTRERGKISVFAKGARKQNSLFRAAANPFVFGTFSLYEGKSSYNLNQVEVTHYFTELSALENVYYGFYFLEIADYYGREGIDEKEMMNLLFVALRALLNPAASARLIRCIFEFRTLVIQGEYPELFHCMSCGREKREELEFFSMSNHGVFCRPCAAGKKDAFSISQSALYVLQYISTIELSKLCRFQVKEPVLEELERIVHSYFHRNTDKKFKSLEILQIMI